MHSHVNVWEHVQPDYSAALSQWTKYFGSRSGLFEGVWYDPNPYALEPVWNVIDKLKKINVFNEMGIG